MKILASTVIMALALLVGCGEDTTTPAPTPTPGTTIGDTAAEGIDAAAKTAEDAKAKVEGAADALAQ